MVDKWLVETEPHEKFNFYTRANIDGATIEVDGDTGQVTIVDVP